MSDDRGKAPTGARGDFVAQLGRRVAELRHGVAMWEADGSSTRLRDDLRRRAHALGSAARVLRFAGMSERLSAITAHIDQITPSPTLPRDTVDDLRAAIEELPALAWGDTGPADRAPISSPVPLSRPAQAPPTSPTVVLVVGPESLGQALDSGLDDRTGVFEWERTEDRASAADLARAVAPDVIVLDGDLDGAQDVAAVIQRDPLTEQVPLVVVATLRSPADASLWLASGASDVLAKPIVRERLRLACRDVRARNGNRGAIAGYIGEATLQDVVARLETELRRGLLDAVPERARQIPIALGEGHDLLAALWSTVSRVREVISERSSGMVRFDAGGPEGTVPIASWAGKDLASDDPRPPRLAGRVVLVADDDPAVTWFLAGVLRAAGAEVLSAHDGETALGMAYRASPDLVISDVLMPKLDGFALCRALKRDVALRDVPVILLSWKEDLLQRVRELGAAADGYLRKEASGSLVLERAEEVLRPRARVDARLRLDGDVQGRLDGLTVPTLLRLVVRHRPDARVTIRDACYVYEVELRDGTPTKMTRTGSDGGFSRGPTVAATVLGVTAGRFVVSSFEPTSRAQGGGALSLEDWLNTAVARIRAAQRLLSGASLLEVREVGVDLAALGPYITVMPEPSRLALVRLSDGESPFDLVRKSNVPPRLLEDVLADAAAHGGISKVVGAHGEDALARCIEHEEGVLRRGMTASLFPPAMREEAPATVRAPSSDRALAVPAIPRAPQTPRPGPTAPHESGEVLGDEDEVPTIAYRELGKPKGEPQKAAALPRPPAVPATSPSAARGAPKPSVPPSDDNAVTLAPGKPEKALTDSVFPMALPDHEDEPLPAMRDRLPSWSSVPEPPPPAPSERSHADLEAVFRASEPPKALHPVVMLRNEDDDDDEPLRPSMMPLRDPIQTTSRVPTLRPPPALASAGGDDDTSARVPPPRAKTSSGPKLPKPRTALLTAESLVEEVLAEKLRESEYPLPEPLLAPPPEPLLAPPSSPTPSQRALLLVEDDDDDAPLIEVSTPAPGAARRSKKGSKKAPSSGSIKVGAKGDSPAKRPDDAPAARKKADLATTSPGGTSASVYAMIGTVVAALLLIAIVKACTGSGDTAAPSGGGDAPPAGQPR